MKLKEKLAEQYAEAIKEKKFSQPEYQAFLSGFELARGIAANIAYSSRFDGTGDELDYIGEEEVK